MNLYAKLKELCSVPAISGRENEIRKIIEKKISPFTDGVTTDALGNLTALKKGTGGNGRIMLCAHMDEVGFLVNFIEDNGFIRVSAVGGGVCFADFAYSKVVSENGVVGVLVPNAKVAPEDYVGDKMYIDIGASTKAQAERRVKIGDSFAGEPNLFRLGGRRVAGRPIDDRVGCLVLLEVAERLKDKKLKNDIYFVFSVQEEVGCRGSVPASYAVEPTEAICVDVTGTGDRPGASGIPVALGKGAAIKIKDRSAICHEETVRTLETVAKANGIPTQREILLAGGTDTSSMQLTAGGCMAGGISIPTRNIHSNTEICDMGDVEACIELAEKYILARE